MPIRCLHHHGCYKFLNRLQLNKLRRQSLYPSNLPPRLRFGHLRPHSRGQCPLPCYFLALPGHSGLPQPPLPHMDISARPSGRARSRNRWLCCEGTDALQPFSGRPVPDVSSPRNSSEYFLTSCRYLICLTIAPCFFSASIYLCLTRIIHVYGDDLARFAPRTYTKTFISCDVLSLVLQAVGGALADTAGNDHDLSQTGVDIMIAGLSFQVASLTVFVALCSDFAWSVRKHRSLQRPKLLRCSERRFKAFLYGK